MAGVSWSYITPTVLEYKMTLLRVDSWSGCEEGNPKHIGLDLINMPMDRYFTVTLFHQSWTW